LLLLTKPSVVFPDLSLLPTNVISLLFWFWTWFYPKHFWTNAGVELITPVPTPTDKQLIGTLKFVLRGGEGGISVSQYSGKALHWKPTQSHVFHKYRMRCCTRTMKMCANLYLVPSNSKSSGVLLDIDFMFYCLYVDVHTVRTQLTLWQQFDTQSKTWATQTNRQTALSVGEWWGTLQTFVLLA
jgi:hypothetical protein